MAKLHHMSLSRKGTQPSASGAVGEQFARAEKIAQMILNEEESRRARATSDQHSDSVSVATARQRLVGLRTH